jgi:mannose-6-phosphate isomerase-like protein (cupin superfamily)
MPVIHAAHAAVHRLNDTTFTSYAAPARGSRELCAWLLELPGGPPGAPHHVTREEVLYILSGTIRAVIDGQAEEASAGDVILVPAGSSFSASNPASEPATAWVSTSVGFAGVLADGTWVTPPWTR